MVKKRIPKKIIKVVEGYTKRLAKEDKIFIKKVIIFGSFAKGTPHRDSDIDVCVISPKFKDFMEGLHFLLTRRNYEEVMAGIEPVGFTWQDFQGGGTLINEIKKTGVEIKS
jgi:predicted nucleotidyltransferase